MAGRVVLEEVNADNGRADGSESAALSYNPRNVVARSLYAGLGFEETGQVEGSETVARRPLRA